MAKDPDRPGMIGLYLFGAGEIFVGLLFALLSLMMLVIPKLPAPDPQVPMPSLWPLALMLSIFSMSIIALGVGTLMAKRWARKIMLILSWYMLIAGLFGILFFVFFMGSFFDNAFKSAPNMTPAVITGVKMGMMGMMGVFYVILPALFVLFYQSKYVSAAVEYHDPQENWMDACPTPVFAVSFFSALGAFSMVFFALMMLGTDFPLYGAVLPVWGMALFLLAMFAALIYISIGSYHLDVKAWWTAVILVIAGAAAYYFMFSHFDPTTAYQQMKLPAAQIDQMKRSGMLEMYGSMSNVVWLMMTPYLAYLLFVRKYFFKG